jgi:hypothetical protein
MIDRSPDGARCETADQAVAAGVPCFPRAIRKDGHYVEAPAETFPGATAWELDCDPGREFLGLRDRKCADVLFDLPSISTILVVELKTSQAEDAIKQLRVTVPAVQRRLGDCGNRSWRAGVVTVRRVPHKDEFKARAKRAAKDLDLDGPIKFTHQRTISPLLKLA